MNFNSKVVLNFGPGPAKLPPEVLNDVKDELISYQNSGLSVMELSHRSAEFMEINNSAQQAVRDLLYVPSNYKVLFMAGGGNGQFAAVPMNLLNASKKADYLVTGSWSKKAAKEATKYGIVNQVLPVVEKYHSIPSVNTWKMDPEASYLYYCDNETIDGIEFPFVPVALNRNIPVVADMSSNIMTREFDVSKFGVIFAAAQKNIGPAGVTLVIVREDLLGHSTTTCPSILDYKSISADNSIYNTPATFSLHVMERVLQWIKNNGGVKGMQTVADKKSGYLYRTIRESRGFYTCTVAVECQSRMNVPFRLKDHRLESKFLVEAEANCMYQLKGHRSVGGFRASLYNAVKYSDVEILVDFMKEFQQKYEI